MTNERVTTDAAKKKPRFEHRQALLLLRLLLRMLRKLQCVDGGGEGTEPCCTI